MSARRSMRVAALGGLCAVGLAACSTSGAVSDPATHPTSASHQTTSSRPAPAKAKSETSSKSRTTSAPKEGLTTYGYGNSRSDDDTVDPRITKLSTDPVWNRSLDGAVYGQPLVDDGVVYVGTENDTIYAISVKSGAVVWHLHVGSAPTTSVIDQAPTLGGGCGDISPLGITGTPVIDPSKHEIFAAEETETAGGSWKGIQHWLVAVSLTTHKELWHRQIDPPHPNTSSHYYIAAEQQRPAATLSDGRIYVEYGGLDGDCGAYHGYVVGLSESGSGNLYSYQVPTQREGGVWGTGGALLSSAGNLYVATGNGSSNSLSHFDEGNSLIELSPTLHRKGYYAPKNWVQLNDDDWDLGSGGPIAIPGTDLLFVVGKPSSGGTFGYLMKDSPLGGIGHGAFVGKACQGGGVFGADATDVIGSGTDKKIYVYTACGGGIEALLVHPTSPKSFKEVWQPSTGGANGSPIVAGGYVWAVNWNSNEVFGMNPRTGHVVYERSTDGLDHFEAPSYVKGRLLIPTQNGVEAFATSS